MNKKYRCVIEGFGLVQNMSGAGGRCYDNARKEGRVVLFARSKTKKYILDEFKTLIWCCFMNYRNKRRFVQRSSAYHLQKSAVLLCDIKIRSRDYYGHTSGHSIKFCVKTKPIRQKAACKASAWL